MKIIIILLILMVSAHISFAEIPNELEDIGNKLSFLTSIANRCNTRLEIMGKKGIRSEPCIEFKKKQLKIYEELLLKEELFLKTATEIDNSSSLEKKLEGKFFFNKIKKNLEEINKVQDHIKFLSD